MTEFPISSIVAIVLVVIMLPLTMQISMRRAMLGKEMGDLAGVAFGDNGDLPLRRRIRAFGNFTEYAPLGLIVLLLMEGAGASVTLVWSAGISLISGRVVHAGGMLYSGSPMPRAIGMMFTYVAMALPAVWLLSQSFE